MIKHHPIFSSESEAERVYLACGKIAVNWGPIELAIESWIVLLRNRQREKPVKPFPVSFSKKVDELKTRLKAHSPYASYRPPVTNLLTEARRLHKIRGYIVHGFCQGSHRSGKVEFGMSEQKRGVALTPKYLTIAEMESAASDMSDTSTELTALFQTVRHL